MKIDDVCGKHKIVLMIATIMKHPDLEHYYCHFYKSDDKVNAALGMCRIVLDGNRPVVSFYEFVDTKKTREIDYEMTKLIKGKK